MSSPTIRTLLVDDDPGDARLLRAALTSERDHGFSIRCVESLRSAVGLLGESPVDVVLLDLGLPDSVGLATYEAFRAAAPDVPVVVLTHLDDDAVALEAVRSGAQDYVVKGTVGELQLARTVRHAAERGRLKAEVERLAAHQRALADLGRFSAEDPPMEEQLTRAAELTAACLGARLAVVVQRRADGRYVIQAGVGDDDLEGELLPPLLANQMSSVATSELFVLDDVESLDLPALRECPEGLRRIENLVVLPVEGLAWSGALALVDTRPEQRAEDSLVFLRAIGMLLQEALRRVQAEFDLRERAKELAALAAVGRLLQEEAPLDQLLVAVAQTLVSGMQFPDRAVARIELDGAVVGSDDGRAEFAEELSAPLVVNEQRRGEVAVGHRAMHGFVNGYEQQLVDAVAENVSLWLERNDSLIRTRDSEAQLRSVVEQMPGLVWTVGTDMRVVWHAGRGHEQISLRPNQRQGRHVVDVLGEDHPMVEAVHDALAGRSAMYESTRDGRSFETRVEPLQTDDGEVIGAIGMAVDVTEARAARRELTESRRRLEGLFNHAHDAFLLADDEGRYLDANPAAARLTGYSAEQLREMRIADLSATGDASATDEEFAAFRASRHATGEWALRRADGEVIDTEFNAVANIVPGVHLSVMTDVTERKRTEAALRRSEERFRRLAENARDVIYRFDVTRSRFEYVSPAVEELVGWTPDQLYADPLLPMQVLTDEDRDRLLRCVTGPRQHPVPFVGRLRLPDGREIWVEERHAYVFDDDGRHVATEGVVRDITASKQVEEELREGLLQQQAAADELRTLNEMKDVFLTAVSHELRTPLTSLKGMSQTLRVHGERLGPEQQARLLDRITANADRLEGLLENLLDLDRLTRGVALLDRREVDVADLTRRVLEQVPGNGHTVTSRLQPARAAIDEPKIERVVENLVVNALRHTDAHGRVWVRVEEDGDGDVVITVEDDGPGVPEHLRERIFEAFELGDSPAARVGGLGIGLNLVARFAELHGGSVAVGDREGGGASFRVRLPKRLDRPVGPALPSQATSADAIDMAGMA